jgi:hypothetical protein
MFALYTTRFLEDAGIARGMKVLDVGTGAGDVALPGHGLRPRDLRMLHSSWAMRPRSSWTASLTLSPRRDGLVHGLATAQHLCAGRAPGARDASRRRRWRRSRLARI